MRESFIENGIEYVRNRDYYIPKLIVSESNYEIRRYGRMREHYLKTERRCYYSYLLMSGKLHEQLHEVDEQAQVILDQFIRDAEKTAPDKAAHQMEWVWHMNNANASANEFINHELIYV